MPALCGTSVQNKMQKLQAGGGGSTQRPGTPGRPFDMLNRLYHCKYCHIFPRAFFNQ